MPIDQLNVDILLDTFNLITIASATVCGFLLGFLAFIPMINALLPPSPPPPNPKSAFWISYLVLSVILSIVIIVFYVEQIASEWVAFWLDPTTIPPLWLRAVGRMLSMLVFIQALALGVGAAAYRESVNRKEDLDAPTPK